MVVMKQIDECLTRFFKKEKRLKKKWQAVKKEENLLCLFHYHHLVLVYDCKEEKILYEWWEKQADKRGLDSAKEWITQNSYLTKTLLHQ